MKKVRRLGILTLLSVAVWLLAVGLGSVFIAPIDTAKVLLGKLFSVSFDNPPSQVTMSILWNLRLPRTVLAFLVGSGLAVSGAVMQSVLRNPLASSFTLGVSSGAAVGAGLVILLGWQFLGIFTLPAMGFLFGMFTVLAAVFLASKLDKSMENTTIILTGMAFSLFANAIMTIMTSLARHDLQQLVSWQMGSFAMKGWSQPAILFPITVLGIGVLCCFTRELDLMTMGEEQALTTGVSLTRVKWMLLGISAILTGSAVSMVGVVGFLDLFTPHVARRLFGAGHRYMLPASALLGGCFMVLCDLLARTVLSPQELPVGAVTAVLGAPFFLYLYFGQRKR